VPPEQNGRLGEASLPTPLLVGAALRAVRIPTNMGVAQLASHAPPLPQLSHAPDFLISCGVCRSGHAGGVPLPHEPIGRGGSALASLGLARYKSRAPLTRRLPPCRPHTTDASERRPYQLAALPNRSPTSTNTASGRGGTPCRPRTTDASERRPYQLAAPLRDRIQRTPRRGVPTNTMPGSLSHSINKNPRRFCRGR